MSFIFISDLHLSDKRQDLVSAFSCFMQKIPKDSKVIIIGDLFDYYMGIDKDDRSQNEVKNSIEKASYNNVQTFFIRGNRDFLMSSKEASYFNMTLLDDTYMIDNIAVTHGDKLCTNDINYIKYRKVTDNTCVRFIYSLFPFFLKKKLHL